MSRLSATATPIAHRHPGARRFEPSPQRAPVPARSASIRANPNDQTERRRPAVAFALLNAVVALIALGAIQLHLADPQLLERLCLEDGIVEWATTAFFLLSGLLFATAAVRASDGRLFVLGLSLLCLFVTGEEISWGQRLFAIDPRTWSPPTTCRAR